MNRLHGQKIQADEEKWFCNGEEDNAVVCRSLNGECDAVFRLS